MILSLLPLLFFGCLTGVTTVLFGFGGGFITVPVVFAFISATHPGDAMHVAIATSTAVMIVNAGSATLAQARARRLRTEYLWPLGGYIALGAALGSVAAIHTPESFLHVLFIAYLLFTITDSVLRGGFVTRGAGQARPLGPIMSSLGGSGIGAIAGFLGVGGSVLTVPLLRRRGLSMAEAAAAANPLSLPVALIGTIIFAVLGTAEAAPGRIGSVDILSAMALLCGSLPTIAICRRLVGKLDDRVHAIAYIALLGLVTIAMVLTAL